jgi:hypothetical protein
MGGVDPNQISQDKDFLGMSPQDQTGYLSSQDPDFAKMAPADQAGYIGHLTGKPVQTAPNASLAPPPRPAFLGTGPTKEGSSAGQSPLIANAPASTTAGTMLDAIKSASSDLGGFVKPSGFSPYPGMGQDEKAAAAGQSYEQDQARQQPGPGLAHGRGLAYRAAVPLAESIGVNVPGMEQSAAEGSEGGVLGHAFAPLAAVAAGEAVRHAPWKTAGDLAQSAAEGTAGVVKGAAKASGIGLSPIEKLVKAAGPSVRDANFPQQLETAAPELARQHATTPVKSVQDMADAAHTAADNLWKNQIEPQITRNATAPISGDNVAKSIRSGIDEGMADLFPEQAKAANSFADKFQGELPLSKANTYLKTLNAQLKGFYKMSPEARAAAGVTDGRISAMENAADSLRQQMYDKLDSLGETDPAGLRQQYGALKQVQNVFGKRAIVSGRQAPLNLPQILGMTGGAIEAANQLGGGHPVGALAAAGAGTLPTIFKFLNSPDMLVKRGISGLAAPTEPFNLTPPAGRMPLPLQQIINLSGGENIPGENLQLTSPGDMPPALQRVLPLQNPGVPSDLYPGTRAPKK